MTKAIGGYLLSVSAAAILLALVQGILPKGGVQRIAVFAGSLLLILAIVSPVLRLDLDDLAENISQIQMDTQAMETGVETQNREILEGLIRERCLTYIWDKAEQLGMSVTVELEMSEQGTYPYPVKANLTGAYTTRQKQALGKILSEDLGIPEERQSWQIN